MKKVNVLGTEYEIVESNVVDDIALEGRSGYCDSSIKRIVIMSEYPEYPDSLKDLNNYKKRVIRHEMIHAFLFESGLADECWAINEEIVDWMANQFPKMLKAFEDANAL